MKKILIPLLLFISVTASAQYRALIEKDTVNLVGTKTNVNAKADTSSITQTPDYIIEKVGSTYYARPGFKSGLPAYSNASFNTVITSAMGNLTSGGSVLIKRGSYTGLNFITVPYSNIIIGGEGNSTILKLNDNSDVSVSSPTGLIIVGSGVNNVTIQNLQLDGNQTNQSKIDNNASTTARLSGVYSVANYTTVKNCYIHDFTQYGFYAAGSATYNSVDHCKLENSGWNQSTFDENTSNCSITNSEIIGGGDVGISVYGVNHTINGNTVHGVSTLHGSTGSMWGIGTEVGGAVNSSGTFITNNKVYGVSMKKGIVTAVSNHITINGNHIDSILTANAIGIDIISGADNVITNNTVYNIGKYGIHLDASTGNKISNNHLYDIGSIGLLGEAFGGDKVDSNTISGNTIKANSVGLRLTGGDNNIVQSNTLYGVGSDDFDETSTNTRKTNNWGVKTNGWLSGKEDKSNLHITGLNAMGSTIKATGIALPLMTLANGNSTLISGSPRWISVYLQDDETLTGVKVPLTASGVYTGSNYNGVALYSVSGATATLVASSTNNSTLWTASPALLSVPFSSTYTATKGLYYVALFYSQSAQTTAPGISVGPNFSSSIFSGMDFTNGNVLIGTSSETTVPSTKTLTTLTKDTHTYFIALY